MNQQLNKPAKEQEEFDIRKIISKLLYHWKFYLASVIVFLALGFLFLHYATPKYTAHAKLLVKDDENKNSSFMNLSSLQDFTGLLDVQSNVYNELEILQTRDLLEQAVREMNLNVAYFRETAILPVELYDKSPFWVNFIPTSDSTLATTLDIHFPKNGHANYFTINSSDLDTSLRAKWGDTITTPIGKISILKTGKPFEDADYFFTLNSVNAVVAAINENLTSAVSNDETSVIELSYNSSVPKKAEDFLSRLLSDYIRRNLNEKNQISDSTLSFIDSRIDIVTGELNDIEANIQGFKQQNKITDLSQQSSMILESSKDYYNKMNEVEVQLNVIKSTLTYLQDEKTNSRPVPSTLYNDPTFLALVQKYNSLLVERDGLSLTTTSLNPAVQNLDAQISNLRNDVIKSLQNQQRAFEINKTKIESESTLMTNMITNVPVQERKFIDLSREQGVKQALYLYLLQKKEETAITKASNIANATVIETPKSDYLPYFPPKILVMISALLLGLIIPSGCLLFKYSLNSRIVTKEDITEATPCSIVAEIGHSEAAGLLSLKENGRSAIAEQLRIFRINMDFLTGHKKCSTILITSSISGEGKSFIAANLAQMYGYSGKKVVLMEMDLRKPKLTNMLGLNNATGFSNIILNGSHLHDFIKPLDQCPNVFLVSSGPLPPNPAELLMTSAVGDLFQELKRNFDIIIIDSPPIGAVGDAQILAKYSDVNLFLVRQNYSYKGSLEIVNDLVDNKKLANLYLVVNDVKNRSYKYGSKYYGYGYGYGYEYVNGNGNGNGNGKLNGNGNGKLNGHEKPAKKRSWLKFG
ncbi:MAG TPA: polysaccharide biosynthesis tyrosine autokinase [Chitinophagaceae bacterium]